MTTQQEINVDTYQKDPRMLAACGMDGQGSILPYRLNRRQTMKKRAAPKRMYTVTDVNAILRVAETVRAIRREYPEHNRMKVSRVVDGVSEYTFKVVRGDRLRFIAREQASEHLLKEVAVLKKTYGDIPKE
jgi:hypothetical protein